MTTLSEPYRQEYLEFCLQTPARGRYRFFSQLARLELGRGPLDVESIQEALDFIDSRLDCADFAVGGMLRILYRFRGSPLLSAELVEKIEGCLLRFKYWWDEPAGDNKRCYWTENHQILFHSAELLAGQYFRGQAFGNDGKDAADHLEHGLLRVRRWLGWRERLGFSEWLSNGYFEEDLMALVNLYEFAEQDDIRGRAGQLIDLLLFEMALHTYRGVMGSTHGRTYPRQIKGGRAEPAANTARLMFGMGQFNDPAALGATSLVASSYRVPALIQQVAADLERPLLARERHSIDVEDAPGCGIGYDDLDEGVFYWGMADFFHEKVADLTRRMEQHYGIRIEYVEQRWQQGQAAQRARHGRVIDPNLDLHALSEVHLQTYRTGTYMLSTAQDFRPGKPGYQQHIWQATLDIDAVVFTNHPGSLNETSRPNFWAGNGLLPRAAQHENVLVCVHSILTDDALPFSHAYFPRAAFDEVRETGGWVFARKGDGFLALYVQQPYRWLAAEDGQVNELRVDAPDCIWLVEMGERARWGSFDAFVQAVAAAPLACSGLSLCYRSPSQGEVAFGWEGDLRVRGAVVALHATPRFDNPYCRSPFGARQVVVRRGEEQLVWTYPENGPGSVLESREEK